MEHKHEVEVECEHCDEIKPQEADCCGKHLSKTNKFALIQPTKTKIFDTQTVQALANRPAIPDPPHKERIVSSLSENKAPPYLQISLPRLE